MTAGPPHARPGPPTPAARFGDRRAAGRALARVVALRLAAQGATCRPLVLALPRGGVPVAAEIAHAIDGDLDLLIARRITVPGSSEVGVGAVAEDAPPVLDAETLRGAGLTDAAVGHLVDRERVEIDRRVRVLRGGRSAPLLTGRTVVIVDDGVATGSTARAVLRWARARRPRHLLFAAPVMALEAHDGLAGEADALACLLTPVPFGSISRWYDSSTALPDADVRRVVDYAAATVTASRLAHGHDEPRAARP